ncbi:tumor protein p53-inducible nuclear protein 2 [Aplochiton taeniatus]
MFGKILSQLLGNGVEDFSAVDSEDIVDDAFEELLECEEGGWVIVKFQENPDLSVPEVDPLENLLIEHPSMSVYQKRPQLPDEEEEEEQEEEDLTSSNPLAPSLKPRLVPVRRHISWMLAAWGSPLPGSDLHLLSLQRARTQTERRKLSRNATQRQNLAKTQRFVPAERRYGHFKQPCQRLYNF